MKPQNYHKLHSLICVSMALTFLQGAAIPGYSQTDVSGILSAPAKATLNVSIEPGTYVLNQIAEVRATVPSGVIRYTIDGKAPTLSSPGFKGTGKILIDSSMTLKIKEFVGKTVHQTWTGEYKISGMVSTSNAKVLFLKSDGTVCGKQDAIYSWSK